jgi:hypothetical protein
VNGSVDPAVFIHGFLSEYLENKLLTGFLSTEEYYAHRSDLQKNTELGSICERLFKSSPDPVLIDTYGPLRIVYLREPDRSEFPFLQGLSKLSKRRKTKLVCFVGHRFLEDIERSLRFNLIHLFEPHQIQLRWSGYDLSARGVFEDVVAGIRGADLCLFDNLGTLNRPNVYIEIGIAHALGKPMLVCELVGTSPTRRRIPDTGSVPSDLQGLLRIQYKSYQDLFRRLYFGLPAFLERHRLI